MPPDHDRREEPLTCLVCGSVLVRVVCPGCTGVPCPLCDGQGDWLSCSQEPHPESQLLAFSFDCFVAARARGEEPPT